MIYRDQFRLVRTTMVIAAISVGASTHATEWGAIRGQFVLDGETKANKITPDQNVEYCSKHDLIDEKVVVGDKGELQNVFIYLNPGRGKKIEVHPDVKPSGKAKVLDNIQCRFEPHAMTIWTAESLEIRNSDPDIPHNANASRLLVNKGFNENVANGSPIEKTFTKSESYPSKVVCNSHAWMSAYVLIRDNPYMALSGKDGAFEIAKIPAGKHRFVFWHEAAGTLNNLNVGNRQTRNGQVEIDVRPGKATDLGVIIVTSFSLER